MPGAVHGYMDVVIHPQFAENHYIYISYTKSLDEKRKVLALARGRWDGNGLTDTRDIFVTEVPGPGRIALDRNNNIYITSTW